MSENKLYAISVVMSVYDYADQVLFTIESVLAQVGVELDFIIVDDGATEAVKLVLAGYSNHPEISVLEQKNQGLTKALVTACNVVKHNYIARIDVGDKMLPTRLYKQAERLNQNHNIGLVSSWVDMLTVEGDFLYQIKVSETDLNQALTAQNEEQVQTPFHASVMFRRSSYLSAGGYRPEFYFAQDVDLWLRMMIDSNLTVIEEVLTEAIFTTDGISGQYRDEQMRLKQLAFAAKERRILNLSDADLLEKAKKVRPRKQELDHRNVSQEIQTGYFIAKCLHDNNSPNQLKYWRKLIRRKPTLLKAWWFYFKAKLTLISHHE